MISYRPIFVIYNNTIFQVSRYEHSSNPSSPSSPLASVSSNPFKHKSASVTRIELKSCDQIGKIYIDRDPRLFEYVLDYLRS